MDAKGERIEQRRGINAAHHGLKGAEVFRAGVVGAVLLGLLCLVGGCATTRPTAQPVSIQAYADLGPRARQLLLKAAVSEIDVVSCNAIEALTQVAPQDGLPSFRKAVLSESPLVRFAGCVALGRVRDRKSLEPLVHVWKNDGDERVRLAAAFAAYRCGQRQGAALLTETVLDHADENLRCDAAYLLGLLDEPRAKRWLEAAAREPDNEASSRVMVHIYTALAMLGDDEAVQRLIEYAQGSLDVRTIALQSLVELKDPAARDALVYRMGRVESYLEPRLIAARGLGHLGDPRGFDLAYDATTFKSDNPDDPHAEMRVRSLAALALGAIGDARALPALKQLAQSDDERIQVAACFAICRIMRPQGTPARRAGSATEYAEDRGASEPAFPL